MPDPAPPTPRLVRLLSVGRARFVLRLAALLVLSVSGGAAAHRWLALHLPDLGVLSADCGPGSECAGPSVRPAAVLPEQRPVAPLLGGGLGVGSLWTPRPSPAVRAPRLELDPDAGALEPGIAAEARGPPTSGLTA